MKKTKQKELKAKEAVYGKKCLEYAGKLCQNTLLLKTAQCSFAEDWGQSLQTFPESGMCVNGDVYLHHNLDFHIKEKEYLLLPTPSKSDGLILMQSWESYRKYYKNKNQDQIIYQAILNGMTAKQSVNLYELIMGFPKDWTKKE